MAVSHAPRPNGFMAQESVRLSAGPATLDARLEVPLAAGGLVILVGVAGGARFAASDLFAARRFHAAGMASLLVDLLTGDEEMQIPLRYDVGLLADRLKCVTAWVRDGSSIAHLPRGYYGIAGGAAAALRASVESGDAVGAIVCRSGRPDLAAQALPHVRAPTLFLVGERDEAALDLNRRALDILRASKRLVALPNAGPLFA